MMKQAKSICGTVPHRQDKGLRGQKAGMMALAAGLTLTSSGAMATAMATANAQVDMSSITFQTSGTLVVNQTGTTSLNGQKVSLIPPSGPSTNFTNPVNASGSDSVGSATAALSASLIQTSAQATDGTAVGEPDNGIDFTATGSGSVLITIPYSASQWVQPGLTPSSYAVSSIAISLKSTPGNSQVTGASKFLYDATPSVSATASSSALTLNTPLSAGSYLLDIQPFAEVHAIPTSPVPELPIPLMLSMGMLVPLLARGMRKQLPG